eukprot:jgi/Astpho2/4368/Aster-x0202
MQVTMISRDESPGFKVSFVRDGQTLTDISVAFDGEMAVKSEWVGRGPEGFPQMEGNVTQVRGKHLIIRSSGFPMRSQREQPWISAACGSLAEGAFPAQAAVRWRSVSRKDDDNKIDDDTRGAVRIFCNELAAAINKYYAFGNCFVDDAQ